MPANKKKILFITPLEASFIRNDRNILNEIAEVVEVSIKWKKGWSQIISFLKQILYYFILIPKVDAVFIEFGGYWALVPVLYAKLFHKKSYIVLHGTDACYLPEINYGYLGKSPIRYFCYYTYKYASTLLPVSESLVMTKNVYACEVLLDNCKQGYKSFFPGLNTSANTVYNGLNVKMWTEKLRLPVKRRKKSFVTVIGDGQFIRKGGNLIVDVARMLPDCSFLIVGMSSKSIKEKLPTNVTVIGKVSQEVLKKIFYETRFYLQLSIFEGFGLSLCESMLCGCVPIGSSVNAIPDIIGDAGYILSKYDLGELFNLIEHVKNEDRNILDQKAEIAIDRIKSNFTLEKRLRALKKIIYGDN